MRQLASSVFALAIVSACALTDDASPEVIEVVELGDDAKADGAARELTFTDGRIEVALDISARKTIDVTVQGMGQATLGLQLFRDDDQLAGITGDAAVRLKSFAVEPGAYKLVILDLSGDGGSVAFTAGTATSRVIRKTLPGYLVGTPGTTAAQAQANFAAVCKRWQETVTALYAGPDAQHPFAKRHIDRLELVDCGTPTLIAGTKQVESTSQLTIVADIVPGTVERVVADDRASPSGTTATADPDARANWMDACLVELARQPDLDRATDVFFGVACSKPAAFDQQPGISYSGKLTVWRTAP